MPILGVIASGISGNLYGITGSYESIATVALTSNTATITFSSIPQTRRCPLVRNWIHTFMAHILKGIFQHTDWFIDINTMDTVTITTGGKRNTRKKDRKCDTYYCPNTRIYRYDSQSENSLITE